MVSWRIDEFTLTTFHLRATFHRDIIACMTPWVRLTTDVRRCLYLNATDRTRSAKDQWFWMQKFEAMLVESQGEKARFLPREEKPHEQARKPANPEPDPGSAVVEFDDH